MTEQITDKELVSACLKNNKAAQKQLFETYARQMLGLCYRYVNDYDVAHDLMQDGFIKVFKNLESYRGDSPLKSWIRRIMVNCCLEHIRREKNRIRTSITDAEQIAYDAPVYQDFLEMDLVMSAISQLPSTMRTVLNLFAIEGYSYSDIAGQLGLEESSVRSNIHRARKQLGEILTAKTKV